MGMTSVTPSSERLTDFVQRIFVALGSAPEEAEAVAHYLVDSNLAGHESHGVVRVPRYVGYVRDGQVRLNQKGMITLDVGSLVVIDGNAGFGQVICRDAVTLGIERAARHGIALVGVRNTGHVGRVGAWAEMAAAKGLVSLHFVNSPGRGGIQVAPAGARERRIAPNPIAIAVPKPDGPPFLLDITSAVIPEGKVLVALNRGDLLPEGAAIDANGKPTRDPRAYYGPPPGALLPIGAHKGFGLCMAIDLLAGALTQGGCSDPRHALFGNNMLSIYIDPARIGSADFLREAVRDLCAWVRSATPTAIDGEILAPGDIEARTRADRLTHGVPLDGSTWRSICETAASLGVISPPAQLVPSANPLIAERHRSRHDRASKQTRAARARS
jgi:uncharacterized oxidoreductase